MKEEIRKEEIQTRELLPRRKLKLMRMSKGYMQWEISQACFDDSEDWQKICAEVKTVHEMLLATYGSENESGAT